MNKTFKKKKFKKLPKDKILAVITLAVLVICYIGVHSMFSVYKGPGVPGEIKERTLEQDGFYKSGDRLYYEDETRDSLPFIDVSAYQGDIDWEKVKEDGISHAFIRIGYRSAEGGSIEADTCYRDNMRNAEKAGIKRGVYFFSQAVNTDEAIEEAKYVLKHVRGKGLELPIAFDMEHISGGDRISGLSIKEKTEITDAFCETIEKHGRDAVVYGNPTWLNRNLHLEYLTDYSIWLAHYTESTDFDKEFIMMQYTDSGKVSGIKGYVDLNLMVKDKDDED